ncbi:hypothetical protein [Clostridium cavendishii]|uniref:hypothetical protein n=1 Tax=Clostridium cavendishii TaxID=349931 RepID=UPI001FA8B33C|nr:hypothetical protein [Clostridium cavendishii]
MKEKRNIHTLSDDEFIKEVIDLGVMLEEVYNNKEFLILFMQIIHSDFRILNNYKYKEERNRI